MQKVIICGLMIFSTLIIPVYADHGTFISITILTGEETFDRDKDIPIRFLIQNNKEECVLLSNIGIAFDEPEVKLLPKEAQKNFTLTGTFEIPPKSSKTFTVNMRLHPDTLQGQYTIKVFARAQSCNDASHRPDNVDGPRIGLKVPENKPSQCIIATATYGSELAPEVQFLRNFRDNIVLSTYSGSRFMTLFNAFYYSWSPHVADTLRGSDDLKNISRVIITPLLSILKVGSIAAENSESGVIVAGILSSAMIGALYITPLSIGSLFALKKRVKKHHIKYSLVAWVVSLALTVIASMLHVDMLMMSSAAMLVLSSVGLGALGLTFILTKLWHCKRSKFTCISSSSA